tara:strand:- start:239 stop:658 length:420 start_codon:yes stop_codon:yes gene_type:complete
MFKKKEFEEIYKLIKNNELTKANNLLISLRKFGPLQPDYLFLMSLLLVESERVYLAIDTLLLSLKVDNTPDVLLKNNFEKSSDEIVKERYKELISMFKKIKIPELEKMVNIAMEKNEAKEFLEHLSKIMPGIRLKDKIE